MRRLRKLGAALFAVAAIGAVMASSALAAATTTDVQWYTGSSPGTVLSGSESISSTLVGTAAFHTNLSGGALTYLVEATGVECVECKIENSGGTAIGSGKLKFTGVTLVEPKLCTVPSTLTTNALSIQADWMSGSTNYWKFTPAAGESTTFVTIPVSGQCGGELTLVIKGDAFGETANATGVQAVEQELHFSETINTAAGGAAGTLHVGTSAVNFTAAIKFKMSGAKTGVAFGTH